MILQFTKMEGLGNDYVYIYCPDGCPENLPGLARVMSDRHRGVGSDGIIVILPSEVADFKMRIFNADGSEARMCGNGARCVGKYVYDTRLTARKEVALETLSGVKRLWLHVGDDDRVDRVTVDMGLPSLLSKDIPVKSDADSVINSAIDLPDGRTVNVTAVSMGNPHAVVFVNDFDEFDIEKTGRFIECHEIFPDRANVEFVQVMDAERLRMRVWERGSGVTMACGTGACASLVAAVANGLSGRRSLLILDGGILEIEWDESTGHVLMTGPATKVFEGTYHRKNVKD